MILNHNSKGATPLSFFQYPLSHGIMNKWLCTLNSLVIQCPQAVVCLQAKHIRHFEQCLTCSTQRYVVLDPWNRFSRIALEMKGAIAITNFHVKSYQI